MSKRLTPQQAANRLGLTVKRIYALIDAGKLAAIDVSIGNERPRWRIDEQVIEMFESVRCNKRKIQRSLAPNSGH